MFLTQSNYMTSEHDFHAILYQFLIWSIRYVIIYNRPIQKIPHLHFRGAIHSTKTTYTSQR